MCGLRFTRKGDFFVKMLACPNRTTSYDICIYKLHVSMSCSNMFIVCVRMVWSIYFTNITDAWWTISNTLSSVRQSFMVEK